MPESLTPLLRRLRLERALAAHDPVVVGARALQLRRDGPVVILCRSGRGFFERLRAVYGDYSGFTMLSEEGVEGCTFTLMDTPIQIVGRPQAVRRQREFRVFRLQVHLLRLIGTPLQEQLQAALTKTRSLETAFARVMGVAELLSLERRPPVVLRAQWEEARRRPVPVSTPPVSTPIPEAAPAEEGSDLLRQPDPLLKERRVTWLDPGRMLPVQRLDLPAPQRPANRPLPRPPKKP
ncbi:MAG: DUF4269 domain-containing protein [Myxococcota bacterium]|nr:DUF4269 domain-containing protein [Myxococcota bacterium]